MFPAPTFTGESMHFSVQLMESDSTGTQLSLEVKCVTSGEITCQGYCKVTK